jgi:hypothetical protein
MNQPYKENKEAYCKRIIADLEQIKYSANILIFSKTKEDVRNHLDSMEAYLDKIKESLISIDNLEG